MSFSRINLRTAAMALAVAVVFATPATARADDEWILRIDLAGLSATGASGFVNVGAGSLALGSGAGGGLSVALEYRFSPRLGVEFGGIFSSLGSGLTLSARPPAASLNAGRYVPLTAGLNVHLTPEKPVDLYVGPMMVYSIFGQTSLDWQGIYCLTPLSSSCGGSLRDEVSNDLGFGLQGGVDVPFGQGKWGFHGSLKYLHVTQAFTRGGSDTRHKVDLNPVVVTAGLSLKF